MKGQTWKTVLAVVMIIGGLFWVWESNYINNGIYIEPPEESERTPGTTTWVLPKEKSKELSTSTEKQKKQKEESEAPGATETEPDPARSDVSTTSISTSVPDHSFPEEDRDPAGTERPSAPANTGEEEATTKSVKQEVPFTPQAPFAEWEDERQQEGCEEASVLMAVYWARDKELTPELAKEKILDMTRYQQEHYGTFVDTAVEDTASRLLKGYFGYRSYQVRTDISSEDIIQEIKKGNLVIVPLDGRQVGNPYYTPPGPDRHNLVITGYEADPREFITNDPGTKRGEDFRYKVKTLYDSIRDYPTGKDKSISQKEKNMIIVK